MFGRVVSFLGLLIGPLMGAETDWAYAPVENPELPKVSNADWSREEMDFFVLAGIEERDYLPTKPAAKRTLIRRAYLDLHGLPPTTSQIDTFLKDESDDAWGRLIDELLRSPR